MIVLGLAENPVLNRPNRPKTAMSDLDYDDWLGIDRFERVSLFAGRRGRLEVVSDERGESILKAVRHIRRKPADVPQIKKAAQLISDEIVSAEPSINASAEVTAAELAASAVSARRRG